MWAWLITVIIVSPFRPAIPTPMYMRLLGRMRAYNKWINVWYTSKVMQIPTNSKYRKLNTLQSEGIYVRMAGEVRQDSKACLVNRPLGT